MGVGDERDEGAFAQQVALQPLCAAGHSSGILSIGARTLFSTITVAGHSSSYSISSSS